LNPARQTLCSANADSTSYYQNTLIRGETRYKEVESCRVVRCTKHRIFLVIVACLPVPPIWLSMLGVQEVAGSNPVVPTFFRKRPFGTQPEGLACFNSQCISRVTQGSIEVRPPWGIFRQSSQSFVAEGCLAVQMLGQFLAPRGEVDSLASTSAIHRCASRTSTGFVSTV
jgi:hypothetical protein